MYVKGTAGQILRFGKGANIAQGALYTFTGDWQRITYSGGTGSTFIISNYSGANATDFEVYGLQHEEGSYATSYIPTYGKTDEGTGETAIQFPSTTAGYWARLYPYYTNEALRWFLRGDGVSVNVYHYYDPASTKIKTLITYDGSAYKVYANGSLIYTWNETAYTLHTGSDTNIKILGLENFMTFNQALSNQEAIDLTTL